MRAGWSAITCVGVEHTEHAHEHASLHTTQRCWPRRAYVHHLLQPRPPPGGLGFPALRQLHYPPLPVWKVQVLVA